MGLRVFAATHAARPVATMPIAKGLLTIRDCYHSRRKTLSLRLDGELLRCLGTAGADS
jgi:hypothetical protein